MKEKGKIRVNITVDNELLQRAKTKLNLFGGKLSTLFNAYLKDFVETMDKDFAHDQKSVINKIRELENRIVELEGKKS